MNTVFYICWVSWSWKTTTVTRLWLDWFTPVYFSGEMKKIALAQWLITAPEEVYRLDSATRQQIEDLVRESFSQQTSSQTRDKIIDWHLVVEDWFGGYRNTFNNGQASVIDHIIFILSEPEHIANNRQKHDFRPMKSDINSIQQAQELSIARAHELMLSQTYIRYRRKYG